MISDNEMLRYTMLLQFYNGPLLSYSNEQVLKAATLK